MSAEPVPPPHDVDALARRLPRRTLPAERAQAMRHALLEAADAMPPPSWLASHARGVALGALAAVVCGVLAWRLLARTEPSAPQVASVAHEPVAVVAATPVVMPQLSEGHHAVQVARPTQLVRGGTTITTSADAQLDIEVQADRVRVVTVRAGWVVIASSRSVVTMVVEHQTWTLPDPDGEATVFVTPETASVTAPPPTAVATASAAPEPARPATASVATAAAAPEPARPAPAPVATAPASAKPAPARVVTPLAPAKPAPVGAAPAPAPAALAKPAPAAGSLAPPPRTATSNAEPAKPAAPQASTDTAWSPRVSSVVRSAVRDAAPAPAEPDPASPEPARTASSAAATAEREFRNGLHTLLGGDPRGAIAELGRACDAVSGLQADACYWAATARLRAGDKPAARRSFEDLLLRFPGSTHAGEASVALGWLALAAGDRDTARSRFAAAASDRVPAVRDEALRGLAAAK